MITTINTDMMVPSSNLQKMLFDKALIKQLAVQLVAGHVEAHLDMMSDFLGEYQTFSEAELCVKSAKETVEDYMADLLEDFREELYSAVRERTITVDAVKFTKEGAVDADVTVS